jgi:hypothetical protein
MVSFAAPAWSTAWADGPVVNKAMNATPKIKAHARRVLHALHPACFGKPFMLISSLFQVKGLDLGKQIPIDITSDQSSDVLRTSVAQS